MKLAILVFMDLEVVFVCANCNIIDLDNVSRTGTAIVSSTKKYYKFQYVYQFLVRVSFILIIN